MVYSPYVLPHRWDTPKDHDMSETRDDCDEFTIYLHICTTGMPNTRTEMIAICL